MKPTGSLAEKSPWWQGQLVPIAVLVLLVLPAIRPIITGQMLNADDYAFHLHRFIQFTELWEQGILFSRWQPDLALGYGIPLLNFHGSLGLYLALPFHQLGFSHVQSLHTLYALSVLLGAIGVYLLLRDNLPIYATITGAVAYAYSPYWQYDIFFRANYAESVAWLWLPYLLWTAQRLAKTRDRHYAAWFALCLAAIIWTHNIFALLAVPLLLGWSILQAFQQQDRRWSAFVSQGVAWLVGLGLASFYWLPAFAEQGLTRLALLDASNPGNALADNFLTWRELLALPRIPYGDLLNPSPVPTLGLIPVLLVLVSLIMLRNRPNRHEISLLTAALSLYIFLTLPSAAFVYEAIPQLNSILFPWRMLGPAAMCVTLLIGFGLASVPQKWQRAAALATCLLLMLAHTQWRNPVYAKNAAQPTLQTVTAFEQQTGMLGTLAWSELLPIAVEQVPSEPRTAWFRTSAEILSEQVAPLSAEVKLVSNSPHTLTFNQFFYPGWQATVDGNPVAIVPSPSNGLISFIVPAQTHDIHIYFDTTPLRTTANTLSQVSFAAIVLLFILTRSAIGQPSTKKYTSISLQTAAAFVSIALFALLLGQWHPTRLNSSGQLTGVQHVLDTPFSDNMLLLGYDGPNQVAADQTLDVTLYWAARHAPSGDYLTTVALRDENGVLWSNKKSERVLRTRAALPTTAWLPQQYASSVQRVRPLAGTPLGRYELIATLFDKTTLQPLVVEGTTISQLVIGSVEVTAPRQQVTVAPANRVTSAEIPALIGYEFDRDSAVGVLAPFFERDSARPGDPLLVTLFWHTRSNAPATIQPQLVFKHTTDETSLPLTTLEANLAGEWRTQSLVRVPRTLENGAYTVAIANCNPDCTSQTDVGSLTVDAPDRLFALPQVDFRPNTSQPPLATLAGVTLNADSVDLVWHVDAHTEKTYRIFVHALNANGDIVAQSDGEPAQWSRPTTGWTIDEYIVDSHLLTLSDETTRLRVGFYLAETGERLAEPIEISVD
ncbi:MAG: 6-pyruvoyl-tetrahydropterin synthase-related protein [Candidatus Promineifilaceae bacterium]